MQRIVGEAEQQRQLQIGEILHLVAYHQVETELVVMPVQILQGGPRQIDFVGARGRLQLLLVVFGQGMDFAPLERKVGGALGPQSLVLAQGQERLIKACGLLFEQAQSGAEQELLLLPAGSVSAAQAGGELAQRRERGLARPHGVKPGPRLQIGQPHHVLRQLGPLPPGRRGGVGARRQLREPARAYLRLGALDNGADFLPHQLGVVAGRRRVVLEYGSKLDQSHGRLALHAPSGAAQNLLQQLAIGGEAHRLRRPFEVGGRHQTAIHRLRKPLQMRAIGQEQRPLPLRWRLRRGVGRRLIAGGRVELTNAVAQQEVDGDGGLAAAGRAGQQQRRLAVQQTRLLAGQVEEQLDVVAAVRLLQAPPLLAVHHQPALRPGIAAARGQAVPRQRSRVPARVRGQAAAGLRLHQREVLVIQLIRVQLRPFLDGKRLKVQKRRVRRHDPALGGGHVVMLHHAPDVDRGGAVHAPAEREQNPVAAAQPRLEYRARRPLESLDAHAGVPQAVLEELQLLAQALPGAAAQRQQVGAHRVVQEQNVGAWHASETRRTRANGHRLAARSGVAAAVRSP